MDTKKEKIRRFISGKFSFNDYLSVTSYFKEEGTNEEFKVLLENDWNDTPNSESKVNLWQLLDRIHHQINLKQVGVKSSYTLYQLISRIAVILIIPALIAIIALSYFALTPVDTQTWAEIHAPVGSRTKFHLPDGSEGWLNSGSFIKYPISFGDERNVEVSGEAWFDVVYMDSKAFIVKTPYFNVKVLGTQFNVIAYDNGETAEVILEKGKVLVVGTGQTFRSELVPNEELKFNKNTRQVTKTTVDSKLYTSWKDGLLIFKNTSMSEIAERLERRYNVEIILHGDSLKTTVFRATFQDEGIDEIMNMLTTVAPIRYKMQQRVRQLDGTFTKGKIEVWLKN